MANNGANISLLRSQALSVPRQKELPPVPWHAHLFSKLGRLCKRLVRWWWTWELLASALSIAATIALIVVLWQADGNAQQSWMIGSTQLTLNTIVAAISTVIRAALLVAVAGALNQSLWNMFSSKKGTSGPARPLEDLDIFGGAASDSWGSLRLLWRTKGLNLAALGAALTILSLAFDTFTQQVLAIDSRNVANDPTQAETTPNALLPRVVNYTGASTPAPNPDMPEAPLDAYGAIVSSIFNTSASLPPPRCSTGNCTWPTTPTIAICSACSNITLSSTTNPTNVTYSTLWGDLAQVSDRNVSLAFIESDHDSPYNVSLLTSASNTQEQSDGILPIVNFYVLGISRANYQTFYDQIGPDQPISTDILDPLMAAYNCSLRFCLQAFNATTTAGQFHQHPISNWDKLEIVDGFSDYLWSFTDPPTDMNIGNESAYFVDPSSFKALGLAFESVISGSAIVFTGNEDLQYGSIDSSYNGAKVNPFEQAFYDASDSLDTMSSLSQQIADGMTTYLRTWKPAALNASTAASDARYAPTVYTTEIIVRVRWYWLAYPLTLLVAGQAFVAATILQTRRRLVRPWKAHRLPLLLADIDDIVKKMGAGGLETRNGLEDRVGQMAVRLQFDERDELLFKRVP